MRPHENLGRRVPLADVREQEQRQQCTAAALDVHPPLSADIIAAVEVPSGVAGVSHARKANRDGSADTLPTNPTVQAEKLVVRLAERGRSAGGCERGAFGAWEADDRLRPRTRIAWVYAPGAQSVLD